MTALITDHYQMLAPGMNYHQGFSAFRFIRGPQNDPFHVTDHLEVRWPCSPEKCRQPQLLVLPYLKNRATWRYEREWPMAKTVSEAIDWLELNYKHEKFLLFLDIFSVHEPWDPPRWYVDLYDPGYEGEEVILPRYDKADYLTEAELRHIRALYAGTVTMLDRWLGRLFEKLHDLGIWDDTALILTSDHGFYLGEHGLIGKHTVLEPKRGWPMYREITHIPLLVKAPGIKVGRQCPALVQLVDLMPTLVELGGEEPPEGIHGRSLLPLLRGEAERVRDIVVSSPLLPEDHETLVWSAVTDGEWCLQDPGPLAEPELHHLPLDPAQERNVFPDHPEVAQRLHRAYIRFLKEIGTKGGEDKVEGVEVTKDDGKAHHPEGHR